MMSPLPNTIGFPPPFFGETAYRLSIIDQGEDWFLMEKPAGLLSDAYPWYPKQMSLTEALRRQAAHKKPELKALWDQEVRSIFTLDPEMSGALAFSVGDGASAHWRDRFGSNMLNFNFLFLALEVKPLEDSLTCELPMISEATLPQSRISHRHGKKSFTKFHRLKNRHLPSSLQKKWGSEFKMPERLALGLWRAETSYPRLQQIRLHASEEGLLILGEPFYTPFLLEVSLKDLSPKAQKGEVLTPIYPALALHLQSIEGLGTNVPKIPLPKAFQTLMQRLDLTEEADES